jgi:hypothetical protein
LVGMTTRWLRRQMGILHFLALIQNEEYFLTTFSRN